VLQGLFATADGLLALDCQSRQQHQALARLLGGEVDPARLTAQLAERNTEHWVDACLEAGIPASTAHEDLALLAADPRLAPSLSHRAYRSVQSPWSFL